VILSGAPSGAPLKPAAGRPPFQKRRLNMELVYAALLLHSAGKKIDEESVSKVVHAAGGKSDAAMIKALVSSLEGVNIEEAISQAPVMAAAPAAAAAAPAAEEKKHEKKEEEKKEEAAAGLSSLFG
jgi:large subunit ribosomal protein L12